MTFIKLFGLCGIGTFGGNSMLAVMPTSMSHEAVLAVNAKECDLTQTTEPDVIVNDKNSQQILCWHVTRKEIAFADGVGTAQWTAGSRDRLLDLNRLNPGAKAVIPQGARVTLPKGSLSDGPEKQNFRAKRNGATVEEAEFSLSVTWKGDFKKLSLGGSESVTLKPSATVTISNLVAVLDGHKHFVHYYTDFLTKVALTERIEIENSGLEIFDCVPPAPLP